MCKVVKSFNKMIENEFPIRQNMQEPDILQVSGLGSCPSFVGRLVILVVANDRIKL